MEQLRIDKWLWAARFFKTRSLATDAVERGKVRIAGERVKPARVARLGEIVQVDNGSTEWEVVVRALSGVRGPAEKARLLYEETAESIAAREREAERRRLFREPGVEIKGRPTKRDRRLLDRATE
ncbi:RNA-binding S4 domain-containing protein [uncultured Oxalicibacterium sp.]|uniref:RNA-binding S4 domain-containing protein n=1 Tax=uncultured Oxalicibacterium sp. TaxID=1168540 RepID=UPI0025DB928D|nr:RNA-binding S4 domain-containing protein [uncultured Oxalicibacterium sp.]